jgi:hypothetical protein
VSQPHRKLISADLTVNMSIQQSCAKLSSDIVENLSVSLCSDVARYIMTYVNLERDVAERLNRVVYATIGFKPDDFKLAAVSVSWVLLSREEAAVYITLIAHFETPRVNLRGDEALEFADRFMMQGGGNINIRSENGEIVSVVSEQW